MSTFKERLEFIVKSTKVQEEYLDRVPTDLRDSIFDNTYSNEQGLLNEFLMKELFGTELVEWVYWFLYDWKPGMKIEINLPSGSPVTYYIMSIDDFCAVVYQQHGVQ